MTFPANSKCKGPRRISVVLLSLYSGPGEGLLMLSAHEQQSNTPSECVIGS